MKSLLFAFILLAQSSFAQTLTNYTTWGSVGKTKSTCVTPPFWYSGYGNYLAPGSASSNTWFYPTTNVLVIIGIDSNHVVSYVSSWGPSGCARGSLTFTDIFYPGDTFRFSQFVTNGTPTNQNPIALISIGFRTNSP